MSIRITDSVDIDIAAPLIAKFRVELLGYKNTPAKEDIESAKKEFAEYIKAGYPIYLYMDGDEPLGYMVCRVVDDCVWVESLFVLPAHRRRGIATKLFSAAEELAASRGGDNLYNFVHPNNDDMIRFLNKRGYNVLNLLEIRRRDEGEKITEQIKVRNNTFDY